MPNFNSTVVEVDTLENGSDHKIQKSPEEVVGPEVQAVASGKMEDEGIDHNFDQGEEDTTGTLHVDAEGAAGAEGVDYVEGVLDSHDAGGAEGMDGRGLPEEEAHTSGLLMGCMLKAGLEDH